MDLLIYTLSTLAGSAIPLLIFIIYVNHKHRKKMDQIDEEYTRRMKEIENDNNNNNHPSLSEINQKTHITVPASKNGIAILKRAIGYHQFKNNILFETTIPKTQHVLIYKSGPLMHIILGAYTNDQFEYILEKYTLEYDTFTEHGYTKLNNLEMRAFSKDPKNTIKLEKNIPIDEIIPGVYIDQPYDYFIIVDFKKYKEFTPFIDDLNLQMLPYNHPSLYVPNTASIEPILNELINK